MNRGTLGILWTGLLVGLVLGYLLATHPLTSHLPGLSSPGTEVSRWAPVQDEKHGP